MTRIPPPDGMAEIRRRVAEHEVGTMVPWTVRDARTGRAVGMTTYLNVRPDNRRLEIGSTWLAVSAQRTAVNPEAKLLLLTWAFEVLDCVAVEFRTHWHNRRSRRAIEALGAKQDGVLRNQDLWRDGTVRDVVVYSVIDAEWPSVRLGLRESGSAGLPASDRRAFVPPTRIRTRTEAILSRLPLPVGPRGGANCMRRAGPQR